MSLVLWDATGRCLDRQVVPVSAEANAVGAAEAITLSVPADAADLLVLDATVGAHGSRRLLSRTASLEPMRRLASAAIVVEVAASEDRWVVRLVAVGAVAAVEARLDDARPLTWPDRTGVAYVDPNVVTLLPGEDATLTVDWRHVEPSARRLRLSGWNVDSRIVSA
jgi:hypothetical protein